MQDDFPGNDPKTIWQSQPRELSEMTLEGIRQKAWELQRKTRRELFGNISTALIAVVISVGGIARVHDPGLRAVFALALVWALAGQYVIQRGMWSATTPGDAGLCTGVEYYRRELNRRSYLFRRVLQWSFGPVVLSVCALILTLAGIAKIQGISLQRILPFCTLFAFWIVAVFVIRSRARRELRREIGELNDIGKDIGQA
jgi:hypothetical protein